MLFEIPASPSVKPLYWNEMDFSFVRSLRKKQNAGCHDGSFLITWRSSINCGSQRHALRNARDWGPPGERQAAQRFEWPGDPHILTVDDPAASDFKYPGILGNAPGTRRMRSTSLGLLCSRRGGKVEKRLRSSLRSPGSSHFAALPLTGHRGAFYNSVLKNSSLR